MGGYLNIPPPVNFPICDVREVAQAHLSAIKEPEARNKRFIISTETLWIREIGLILKDKFGEWYDINPAEHETEGKPKANCSRTQSE